MNSEQDTFSPSCFLASIILTSVIALGATHMGLYFGDFWIWNKNVAYLGTAICLVFLYWGFKGLKDDADLKRNSSFEIDNHLTFKHTHRYLSNHQVPRATLQSTEVTGDGDGVSPYSTEADDDSQYRQDIHFLAECKRKEVQNHNFWVGLDAFSWWFMDKDEEKEYLKRRDRFFY